MKNLFTKICAELGGLTRDGSTWGVGTVSVLKVQGEGAVVTGTQSATIVAGSCLTAMALGGRPLPNHGSSSARRELGA